MKRPGRAWIAVLLAVVAIADCSFDDSPEAGAVGSPCQGKADCEGGMCLPELMYSDPTGWPGGYCTQPCSVDDPCPGGSDCLELGDGQYCIQGCATHGDCRPGYLCQPVARVCLPDCRRGWPCGDQLVCGPDGFCVIPGVVPPDPDLDGGIVGDGGRPMDAGQDGGSGHGDTGVGPEPTRPMGAPCDRSAQCATDYCEPQRDGEGGLLWRDGYCTLPCAGTCPTGSVCLPLPEGARCLGPCRSDGTCRPGYACHPRLLVCVPDCRDGFPCPPGASCTPRGVCAGGGGGRGGGGGGPG